MPTRSVHAVVKCHVHMRIIPVCLACYCWYGRPTMGHCKPTAAARARSLPAQVSDASARACVHASFFDEKTSISIQKGSLGAQATYRMDNLSYPLSILLVS